MTSSDATNEQGNRRGFEALAVILLSLATIGTAWCSYQASNWNSQSAKQSIQSIARGRDASDLRIKANQLYIKDIFLFSQFLSAHDASNEPLADFYARQFSPELKQAFEKETNSSSLSNASVDPFTTNLYQTPLVAQADALEPESERLWEQSLQAARTGGQYTLISVLLATALFFSGTAPQFQTRRKRRFVLALGLAALVSALVMFLALPQSPHGRAASFKVPPEVKR